VNITGWLPLLILGVYNSWAAICNIFSAIVVDRVGRIRSICLGFVSFHGNVVSLTQLTTLQTGCILFMSIVAGLVANFGSAINTNQAGAAASIAMMFCFVTCYAAGIDAPSYVYCSEIFPTNIRFQGVGSRLVECS
jgi:MFS family permease